MEVFDRVTLTEDIKITTKDSIPIGTIGTIRQILEHPQNGQIATVQFDYIEERQQLVPLPLSMLKLATVEDLDGITTIKDCIKILNPLFHMGNRYITLEETKFEITGLTLATNELKDLFQITWLHNRESDIVTRNFIDIASHYEFVKYDEPPEVIPISTNKKTEKVTEKSTEKHTEKSTEKHTTKLTREDVSKGQRESDDIKITINNTTFEIRDDMINLGSVRRSQLKFYIEQLIKLNNLLNYEEK